MWREAALIGSLAATLAACAARPASTAVVDERNRPLEQRCVRANVPVTPGKPGLTQAEVQAEARAAARRGELDKACDWL